MATGFCYVVARRLKAACRELSYNSRLLREPIAGVGRLRAGLLVKLSNNAKAEKRPAGLVCNFHPPLRTSFQRIILNRGAFRQWILSLPAEPRLCRETRFRRSGQTSRHRDPQKRGGSDYFFKPL